MKQLLSIVIPLYNTKEFIEPCLNSILESTSTDYEVIVVDDGSTDGSELIVDEYASRYSQLRIIHQPNSGVAVARNNGLEQAKGEYIWFVDSDDMIASDGMAAIFDTLTENRPECLMIMFSNDIQNSNLNTSSRTFFPVSCPVVTLSAKHMLYCMPVLYICKKEIYTKKEINFRPNICYEDELFVPLLLSNLKSCLLLDLPIYLYRKREGSFMNRPINRKQIESRYIIAMELYDHFRNREEWKWIKPRIFNLLINVAKKSLVSGNEQYFNNNFRTRIYFKVLRQTISSKRSLLEYCILRVNSKFMKFYL